MLIPIFIQIFFVAHFSKPSFMNSTTQYQKGPFKFCMWSYRDCGQNFSGIFAYKIQFGGRIRTFSGMCEYK